MYVCMYVYVYQLMKLGTYRTTLLNVKNHPVSRIFCICLCGSCRLCAFRIQIMPEYSKGRSLVPCGGKWKATFSYNQ